MTREEIKDELEEVLKSDCLCGFITKKEMTDCLNDVDKWLKNAKSGDKYFYDGNEYELEIEYEIAVWKNKSQRDGGDPIYMSPICSCTDLDAIKQEAEKYDIERTGCIEIFEIGENDAILHYENKKWFELK